MRVYFTRINCLSYKRYYPVMLASFRCRISIIILKFVGDHNK